MEKISISNYALSFWKRDILSLFYSALFSIGIFFFLLLSLRLQFFLSGTFSFAFPEGLKSSPEFLLYLSVFSLIFLLISILIFRMEDIGIMMAVGGNQWVCIKIYFILCLYYTAPSILIGSALNYLFVSQPGDLFPDFFYIHSIAILIYLFCLGLVVVPFVYIATLRDTYQSIRRVK